MLMLELGQAFTKTKTRNSFIKATTYTLTIRPWLLSTNFLTEKSVTPPSVATNAKKRSILPFYKDNAPF